MKERKCKVVREEITTEELKKIRDQQQNVRMVEEVENNKGTALKKAIRGSEIFLKAQGYVKK